MGNDPKENATAESGSGQARKPAQEPEPHHHDDWQDFSDRNLFGHDRDEVIVRQLPERLNSGEGHTFFCQVEELLNTTQPRFVFDFTRVGELDAVGIHLLLKCLEEVMKLNGDVKLAAVPPGPTAILELTGVDRLFEIFDSTGDAVKSFHYFPPHEEPMQVPLSAGQARTAAETAGYGAD